MMALIAEAVTSAAEAGSNSSNVRNNRIVSAAVTAGAAETAAAH